MKILGIIPARGGSKGVPRKNIKRLNGKPLIQYTIDTALESNVFTELIVSTEDVEIASVSEILGASIPFFRPIHLASDDSPTFETVLFTLKEYIRRGIYFDAICLLQPTTPLRKVETIVESVKHFIESGADALISVREVPHQFNPHWVFERIGETDFLRISTGDKDIITRRQDLPHSYYRDGEIYLVKSSTVLEKGNLFGDKIAYQITESSPILNIDTQDDWVRAESLIKRV